MQISDEHDVQLGQSQDDELLQLVTAIQEQGQEQLESVFKEAGEVGEEVGDEVRQAWERDVVSRREFFEDQLKNSKHNHVYTVNQLCGVCNLLYCYSFASTGTSKRGNRWSTITFRIGMCITFGIVTLSI